MEQLRPRLPAEIVFMIATHCPGSFILVCRELSTWAAALIRRRLDQVQVYNVTTLQRKITGVYPATAQFCMDAGRVPSQAVPSSNSYRLRAEILRDGACIFTRAAPNGLGISRVRSLFAKSEPGTISIPSQQGTEWDVIVGSDYIASIDRSVTVKNIYISCAYGEISTRPRYLICANGIDLTVCPKAYPHISQAISRICSKVLDVVARVYGEIIRSEILDRLPEDKASSVSLSMNTCMFNLKAIIFMLQDTD